MPSKSRSVSRRLRQDILGRKNCDTGLFSLDRLTRTNFRLVLWARDFLSTAAFSKLGVLSASQARTILGGGANVIPYHLKI